MAVSEMIVGIGILGILIVLVTMALSIFVFVFWILMIIDCVKRKFKQDVEKIVWILVIIFAGIVGALIYYFVVKKK
ncbi:PLDc N-terminal domain-containing protein [Candidatus Pacearchaeota archaeon]|nr:PLDc N-terminal domain-containing protein [Candidatus Pacearchaeota archaeon]